MRRTADGGTDRMRRLTYIMIASSIFMLAVFTVAANWLPADATTVLGPMSICLSR